MTRAQNKRIKERMYKHLKKNGSMTYYEVVDWYNNTDHRLFKDKAGGAQHGTTGYVVSNILARSILFEEDGVKIEARQGNSKWSSRPYKLYRARDIDIIVQKAIASKKPLKVFPSFVQKEIRRVLHEKN
jgi:hypothetical protein